MFSYERRKLTMLNLLIIAILGIHSSSAVIQRLPDTIKPDLYDLHLKIDTSSGPSFSGYVQIKIICIKTTRTVVLHANRKYGLNIFSDEVKVQKLDESKGQITVKSLTFDDANQLVNINLDEDLVPENSYIMRFLFQGPINDQAKAFIIHSSNGRYLIAANFKRTYARTVFPCFDEPAMKAKFRVSIEHNVEEHSISNTPLFEEKESTETPGLWVDKFFPTTLISTYQVSFVVYGIPLEQFNGASSGDFGLPVTFSIRKRFELLAKLGSELAASGLELHLELYKLPSITGSVLKKIDYVLVPGVEIVDSSAQGLILNSEYQYFMGSSKDYSVPTLHMVYQSLVRQWFGVALTPAWWDSEWLLSCLARYVPLFLLPDTYFNSEILPEMFSVMDWDSLPDGGKVNSVQEIDGAVVRSDSDTKLNKGLMVLHMLHKTIGMASFNQGVQEFALTYISKSVYIDDFWNIIDKYTTTTKGIWPFKSTVELIPKDIGTKQFMTSWTDQEGYPMLYVERRGSNVKVSQARFYLNSPKIRTDNNHQCWWIPLTYTTEAKPNDVGNTEAKEWLGCNKKFPSSIILKNVVKANHWIVFNNKLSGLYRVSYDKASWGRIIASLNNPKKFNDIHRFNRAQLINDALTLSWKNNALDIMWKNGLDFEIVFRLLSYMRHEADLFVWKSFFMSCTRLTQVLKRSPVMDDFKEFMKRMMAKVYETVFPSMDTVLRYINEDTSPIDSSTMMSVHMWSCMFMVPTCIKHSNDIVTKWKKTGEVKEAFLAFPRGLIMSVFCSAMVTEKGEEIFSFVFDKLKTTDLHATNRELYVEVMTCTRSISAIDSALLWATSTSPNENMEEKIMLFSNFLSTRDTYVQARKYFITNFDNIKKFFSPASYAGETSAIESVVRILAWESNTVELNQLRTLLKGDNALKNSITDEEFEEIKLNAQEKENWLEANSNSIKVALFSVKKV